MSRFFQKAHLKTSMISLIYFSHSLYRASKDKGIISNSQSAETTSSILNLSRIPQLVWVRESGGQRLLKWPGHFIYCTFPLRAAEVTNVQSII